MKERKVGHRTVGPNFSTASGSLRDGVYTVGLPECTVQDKKLS
jgi:hypothetical protein